MGGKGADRKKARSRWQALIRRVYPDALKCPRCGGIMKFLGVIMEWKVIRRILEHCGRWPDPFPEEAEGPSRGPP